MLLLIAKRIYAQASGRCDSQQYSLVTNLADDEKATLRADVVGPNLFRPVHDGGARGTGNSVIVGLANAANGADARFDQEMLREIYEWARG